MGGCEDDETDHEKMKTKLQELLEAARVDVLEEDDDESDPPDTRLVPELIKAIKVLQITWSVSGNQSYIDVAIAKHHQDDDVYFFLRQCVDLIDGDTGSKQKICCGVLIDKLNNMDDTTRKNALLTTNSQYYIPNDLAKRFTGIVSLVFLIGTFSNTSIIFYLILN